MKVCYGPERPTEFKTEPNLSQKFYVFKREKELNQEELQKLFDRQEEFQKLLDLFRGSMSLFDRKPRLPTTEGSMPSSPCTSTLSVRTIKRKGLRRSRSERF